MLKYDEPMSKHCSLRAGGITREFCSPENIEELSEFLNHNHLPVLFLGLGSNLLVRDNGFNGVTIHTKHLNELTLSNGLIGAEVGATLAKLSRFAQTNLKHGAEFLSAIPGSVGGALAMNAGAFGSEIWQYVVSVRTINLAGKIQQRDKSDFVIDYRSVTHNHVDEFFISAQFDFDLEEANDNVRDLLHKRNSTQPIGLASCGSVFKNPNGNYAAKLIEESGLKGYCIGGACVSEKHANYIINQDNASSSDIEKLILHIQNTVKTLHKVELEPEIIII
ncbi:MAG: UDP-N-acetylmuramate dehydrogenase [Candidatus Thioglobus sp.]|jgi:UDP-N-acetylmuramate dehydrogenase|nr:UDP-N-acetylmuramate dehydrogenase [Candidatus Thioglobus sp.]|tara:strand:+ start:3563 stop:4396 length:834 start_codon:yes stop_codon:yes gene_type:complete